MNSIIEVVFWIIAWLVVAEALACIIFPGLVSKLMRWMMESPDRLRHIGAIELCIGLGLLVLLYLKT